MTIPMLRPCPTCVGAIDAWPPLALHVITADGISHAVPAGWLSSRRQELERDGVSPVAAMRTAYLAWVATCARAEQAS